MNDKRAFPKWPILFISALALFLFPTSSLGATFCVSNKTDLQSALTFAASNGEDDTIQIVQGAYSGNFTYASEEANNLTVEGGYTGGCSSRTIDPENTVLDGGGLGHVLALVSQEIAAFSLEGLTLQNGNASTVTDGGGLYIRTSDGGDATLTNNTFSGNTSTNGSGGGVYVTGGGTLTNNTFIGNTAGGTAVEACMAEAP